jgi:REP-associated tyrosine transposase
MVQLGLLLPVRGGARPGAGRKRKDGRVGRPGVAHERRPRLDGRTPVHVTMRLARGVPNLRSQRLMRVVWRVFGAARDRLGARLVHWAVQRDHVHLIVEPEGKGALSRAMQGLCIRFAKRLNAELGRRGRVFGDRYHEVLLDSPRKTRHALAYVLLQERHHAALRGERVPTGRDPCSSAPCFDGWTVPCRPRDGPWTRTVVAPAMWLLRVGWRRHGLVDPLEVPGGSRR